jgi:ribosomal protein S18 acetylase RimI-like enzyme
MSCTNVQLVEFKNDNIKNRHIVKTFLDNNYPIDVDDTEWTCEDMMFLVLLFSGNIIGIAITNPYDNNNKVHLVVIFISENWRKKGYGTHMLKHIAKMYQDKEITLSVNFENTSVLHFYQNHNYAKLKEVNCDSNSVVLSLCNDVLCRNE